MIKLSLLKIKEAQTFKLDFFVSLISIFIKTIIIYFLFDVLFSDSNTVSSVSLTRYTLLASTISMSYDPMMYVCYELMGKINSSEIIPYILKPVNYIVYNYFEKVGIFLLRFAINITLVIIINAIFFDYFSISRLLIGVYVTIVGATILFFLQFLIGTYTPHVKDVLILRDVIITILFTFGGLIIPVEYLPFNLDIITKCTMIPYIYSFPANVISGNPLRAMDFAMQLAWVILLGVLTLRSYQKNVSHNVEYGD